VRLANTMVLKQSSSTRVITQHPRTTAGARIHFYLWDPRSGLGLPWLNSSSQMSDQRYQEQYQEEHEQNFGYAG